MIISQREKMLNLCKIFVFIEIVLGILIHFISNPKYVQYVIIVLACIFCILFAEKSKSYIFTQIALVCTLLADFFLVCLDANNQLAGMVFFTGTQTAYFLRIYFEEDNHKIRKIHLIARISATILIIIATYSVLGKNTDAVAIVSMMYFMNLIFNAVFSFINFKKSPLLAIGFIFFVLCDVFVGLACISPYFSVQEGTFLYSLVYPGINAAWIFYVPSQILLSISLLKKK